jgi:hypothetical protein
MMTGFDNQHVIQDACDREIAVVVVAGDRVWRDAHFFFDWRFLAPFTFPALTEA